MKNYFLFQFSVLATCYGVEGYPEQPLIGIGFWVLGAGLACWFLDSIGALDEKE